MNLTKQLSDYIQKQDYNQLSENDIQKAKLCLIDWIAVTLAGFGEPVSKINHQLFEMLGGSAQATIIGKGLKTNLLFASLVNATSAHALDFDDVHIDSSGHAGAPVISAILPLAEWKSISGRDFINAFAVGVHVFFSLGAGNMPLHYQEGWHNTGTFGHVAAAAAAAKLLKLNKRKTVNAIGIAVTQAAGLQCAFGTMCKPFNAGKAAMDGLLAVLLAEREFGGPDDSIGGKSGFLEVFSSTSRPRAMEKALAEKNFMSGIAFKRHPSCFATHAAIECMLALRRQHAINLDDIAEIQCTVYSKCLDIAAIAEPKTGLEGKFSVQFCLALALEEGLLPLKAFNDLNVSKPSLCRIMKKVKLIGETAYDKTRTSKVIIKFTNGSRIQKKVVFSELMSNTDREEADVTRKFKQITSPLMAARNANRILDLIKSLETIKNMGDIVNLCRIS